MSKHPKRITPGRIVPVGQPTQFGWDKRPDLVTCEHGFVLDPGEECAECGDRDAVQAAKNADFDRPLTTEDIVARFNATPVSDNTPPAFVRAVVRVDPSTGIAAPVRMATDKQVGLLMKLWRERVSAALQADPAKVAAAEARARAMTIKEASERISLLLSQPVA